jgi:predicted ABC-type transport system involved in lysophospholipase L1 biosynthesis ATPase subunit
LLTRVNKAPQLMAHDLRRSFKIGSRRIEVLRGITLVVEKGEAVFLCGVSGAGKTTLLYTLAGLERPEAGDVVFEGHRLYRQGSSKDAKVRNLKMGFVFQSYFLLPELTALENVLLPSMIANGQRLEGAKAYLERVGLADRMNHLPSELSGGEQQRVAIARALVNDPAIIFADEPTGNLDTANGEAIMELLLSLAKEKEKTLMVVTHDARLASLGDRQLNIRDGRLIH